MKRALITTLGLVMVSVLSVGQSNATARIPTRVLVETFVLPPIPASFRSAEASVTGGQTILTYSINEGGGRALSRFQLIAFILAPSGEVKSGQGWTMELNDREGVSAQRSITLRNVAAPGDRVVLTVWGAEGRSGKFTADITRIVERLGAYRSRADRGNTRSNMRLIKATARVLDACTTANCVARNTCGCGGVSSFSCNPQTGEYSFGCYPRNGCQDPVPEDCGQS